MRKSLGVYFAGNKYFSWMIVLGAQKLGGLPEGLGTEFGWAFLNNGFVTGFNTQSFTSICQHWLKPPAPSKGVTVLRRDSVWLSESLLWYFCNFFLACIGISCLVLLWASWYWDWDKEPFPKWALGDVWVSPGQRWNTWREELVGHARCSWQLLHSKRQAE